MNTFFYILTKFTTGPIKTILFLDGVYRAEKHTGANMVVMSEGISNRPMGISIYSSQRQKCR